MASPKDKKEKKSKDKKKEKKDKKKVCKHIIDYCVLVVNNKTRQCISTTKNHVSQEKKSKEDKSYLEDAVSGDKDDDFDVDDEDDDDDDALAEHVDDAVAMSE